MDTGQTLPQHTVLRRRDLGGLLLIFHLLLETEGHSESTLSSTPTDRAKSPQASELSSRIKVFVNISKM